MIKLNGLQDYLQPDSKINMPHVIPLFPLRLVVFPASKYPLHIFEPHYKKMISWCEENNIGFGICSLINEDISHIGTYVKIHQVLKRYENDELDIIVKGTGRISVKEISIHPDGYHIGSVEDYSDLIFSVNEDAVDNLKIVFLKLINLVDFKLDNIFWESFERTKLKSFKLAEKSGLTLEQQQELITLTNENSRINFLIEHLYKLNKEITEKSVLKKIVSADGYLN